jgi:hypothetical protein
MGITRSMAGELAGICGMAREIFESEANQLQQSPRGEETVEEQERDEGASHSNHRDAHEQYRRT